MNILTIVGFFTSLFNIASIGDWFLEILYKCLLFLDGFVYTLLAYSFKLFQLMCTLNFNSLYGLISPVLTRIEALIMVFVIYKVGITLITFMLNPEEASKKGKDILINIFVAAALLLSYNTIFTLFNELSMLIIGSPEGYNYVVLGQIADVTESKDSGLINRLVFGTDDQIDDIGEYIAFSTCSTFITDSKDPQDTGLLRGALNDNGKVNFWNLPTIAGQIGKQFDYFVIVGFLGAIYMIYVFIKTTIQVGVRAFKLLILQVMAPIAIITIIGEGIKGKTFSNFIKKYISVYIEVFIRMFSLLLISNFAVKFVRNIVDYFPTVDTDDWWTYALMILLILLAAFRFAGDIPKFIDDIIGTHLSDGKNDNSFGKYLGGLAGLAAGGVTGFFGGLAGGGFGAGIAGLRAGLVGGASAGAKGNNIADWFKGQGQVYKDNVSRGQNVAARGGLIQSDIGALQTALGVGDRQDRALARIGKRSTALEELEAAEKMAVKDSKMDFGDTWVDSHGNSYDASGYSAGFNDVKLGEDKDAYASKMVEYDTAFQSAQSHYDYLVKQAGSGGTVSETEISKARTEMANARMEAEQKAKAYYDYRKEIEGNKSDDVQAKRKAYAKIAKSQTSAKDRRENKANNYDYSSGENRTKEKRTTYESKARITNKSSYARTHGGNPKNK